MIAETEVENAVTWLARNAQHIAAARAEMVYCDEYRKSLKAILMAESNETANNAKETWAYAHPKYLEHLLAYKKSVLEYEKMRAMREAAMMKIDAWRSMNANYRAIKV